MAGIDLGYCVWQWVKIHFLKRNTPNNPVILKTKLPHFTLGVVIISLNVLNGGKADFNMLPWLTLTALGLEK